GGVVAGIRDYGNRVGIPTVAGGIVFDEGYLGSIVVNVACVGFAKKSQLVRNRASSVRDVFILCGGKTGRDGIHGVTYASVDLTDRSVREWEAGAVQLGDPILKEPLIHACIESAQGGLLDGMKDLGGGGLSCVVGEMALAGGFGAEVDVERVPLKEEGLAPWEIWVSESQERMMLAVLPENVEKVLRIFELYDVPATVIGRAIPEKICRVRYRKATVLDLDLEFYTGGPEYTREYRPPRTAAAKDLKLPPEPRDYRTTILRLLSAPNIASKESVIRQYDHEVLARGRPRARGDREGPRFADSFRQRVVLQRVTAWTLSADACRLRRRHRRGFAQVRHDRFQEVRRPGRPRRDHASRARRIRVP